MERISWIVVSYLVATTIAAPVYGRLGDVLGRKRLMFVALALFIAASFLCAVAPTILALTGARILQGFGGGGLMTCRRRWSARSCRRASGRSTRATWPPCSCAPPPSARSRAAG